MVCGICLVKSIYLDWSMVGVFFVGEEIGFQKLVRYVDFNYNNNNWIL